MSVRQNGTLGSHRDIDPDLLVISKAKALKPIPAPETLRFGEVMTDHMLVMNFTSENGWSAPIIKPYGPLELDPASSVLHYTTSLFEGLKAYSSPDGSPRLFRPDLNMKRMIRSTERVGLPVFNAGALLDLIKKLVVLDRRWIPAKEGYSLYVRPTLIGTSPGLAVATPTSATLFVILSPAGPYFPSGFKPITLLAEYTYVRSWPGGTGEYKLGLNYTPCFRPQEEAAKKGYQQILWILGEERKITEVGQMNFFIVVKRDDGDVDLMTPALDGTILPGVTRNSVIRLAALLPTLPALSQFTTAPGFPSKIHVRETVITMPQLLEFSQAGLLCEAFGSGTAAIVAPVSIIGYEGHDIILPVYEGGAGPVASATYNALVAIQDGRVECEGWGVRC